MRPGVIADSFAGTTDGAGTLTREGTRTLGAAGRWWFAPVLCRAKPGWSLLSAKQVKALCK